MSDLVKVWNDNEHIYREVFQGEQIIIPPGGFLEMERDKAVLFKGTFKQPIMIDGIQDPHSYKMIRIEIPKEAEEVREEEMEQIEYKCMACNKEFKSQKSLDRHIKMHHSDIMEDEDAKKKLMGEKDGT